MQTQSPLNPTMPPRRRRVPITMTPVMWALLFAFLTALLLTSCLTFLVVRDYFLSRAEPAESIPAFVPTTEESLPPGVDSSLPLQAASGPAPKPWKGNDRVNVLLIGLDLRDWEEGGAARTDTMLLLSLDPEEHTAAVMSIPRDLWVNIPGFEYGKINTAYYLGEIYNLPGGGPGLAVQTVEELLGVDINFYARVDFNAFVEFINLIGGVDIEVPEEISVDPIGPHNTVTLQPGLQTLDGETALAYARNRDTIGGDFDRAQRQQQVILGIRSRILDLDLLPQLVQRSPQIYKQLSQGVYTNLTLDQLIRLALEASRVPREAIKQGSVGPDQVTISISPDGLDILLPDLDMIRQLRDDLFTAAGPVKPLVTATELRDMVTQEAAKISVLNATYTVGLAAETTEFLSSKGIYISETGNAQEVAAETAIIDYTGNPNTTQYLAQLMNLDPSHIYGRYDPNSKVDVVILLGDDWAQENPMP